MESVWRGRPRPRIECHAKSRAAGEAPAPHSNSSFYRCAGRYRQFCFLPGAKSAADVDHVLKTGALQQAAGNHAAIAALAVDRQRNIQVNLRRRNPEAIQRPPRGSFNVTCHPFRFAADVEHAAFCFSPAACCNSCTADLAQRCQIESRARFHPATPPSRYPRSASMPTRARRRRASDNCSGESAISTGRDDKPENRSRPGSELSRQRNVDGTGHVAGGKLLSGADIQRDHALVQHGLSVPRA